MATLEIVNFSPEELTRMEQCERELQQVLAKYGCELHYAETRKNGVVVQTQFMAEPTRKLVKV